MNAESITQTISTIASIPFTLCFVALIRKFWTSVDGIKATYAVGVASALVANVLGYLAARGLLPIEAWVAIGSIVGSIMAVGGSAFYDRVKDRQIKMPVDALQMMFKAAIPKIPSSKESTTDEGDLQ